VANIRAVKAGCESETGIHLAETGMIGFCLLSLGAVSSERTKIPRFGSTCKILGLFSSFWPSAVPLVPPEFFFDLF
jgi:hypothetical protein